MQISNVYIDIICMNDCNHDSPIYDIIDTYNSEGIISHLDGDKMFRIITI